MTHIVITIALPKRVLSPNSRHHYMARHGARKVQRTAAWALALEALDGKPPPKWKRATMRVRWYHPTMLFPDADGCLSSLKGAIDGLADANVIENDRWLEIGGITREKDAKNPRVEITVEVIQWGKP